MTHTFKNINFHVTYVCSFVAVESSDNIEISNVSPTEHVIVSSSGNLLSSKIQMTTVGASSTEKIIASKSVPSRGHQNVLQRPLSMSNVSSFKKPVTSFAAGPRNVSIGLNLCQWLDYLLFFSMNIFSFKHISINCIYFYSHRWP